MTRYAAYPVKSRASSTSTTGRITEFEDQMLQSAVAPSEASRTSVKVATGA
jgi:hypothetical protein